MDIKEERHDFLIKVYEQSHVLAREHATKREQLISIYLIIFGAYFGLAPNFLTEIMQVVVGLAMIVIGGMCVLITITHRTWVIRYSGIYESVGKLIMSSDYGEKFTVQELGDFLHRNANKEREGIKGLLKGSGNKVILMFIFLTALPILILYEPVVYFFKNPLVTWGVLIGGFSLYIFLWTKYMIKAIDDARDRDEPSPMIRFYNTHSINDCKGYVSKKMENENAD